MSDSPQWPGTHPPWILGSPSRAPDGVWPLPLQQHKPRCSPDAALISSPHLRHLKRPREGSLQVPDGNLAAAGPRATEPVTPEVSRGGHGPLRGCSADSAPAGLPGLPSCLGLK